MKIYYKIYGFLHVEPVFHSLNAFGSKYQAYAASLLGKKFGRLLATYK